MIQDKTECPFKSIVAYVQNLAIYHPWEQIDAVFFCP